MGFSFTKATYTLAQADKEAQTSIRDVRFPELKRQLKNGEIDHLLFEDESMIRGFLKGSSVKSKLMAAMKGPSYSANQL